MGFPPTFPNALSYAPLTHGGLGLKSLFCEQGLSQTLLLLRHLRARTSLASQLLICLRWYQVVGGLSSCVLQDTRPLPDTCIPWWDSFRDFLSHIDGSIVLEHPLPLFFFVQNSFPSTLFFTQINPVTTVK